MPMVWPELRTSSSARWSRSAVTASANRRSSRARALGATARQDSVAACARAMAASVSASEVSGTVATTCSVAGLITSKVVVIGFLSSMTVRLVWSSDCPRACGLDQGGDQAVVVVVLFWVPLHAQYEGVAGQFD